MMIDEILENNRRFVAGKGYEKHITDGKPSGKTLIVTCMDTRLSVMLPEALGIKNGEVKMVKVAGGVILDDYEHQVKRKIERFGDRPDFPRLDDFGLTCDDLNDYLFDKQAILDSGGSLRTQLTVGGILFVIPILILSMFPEDSLPWGSLSFFVGIAIGLLAGFAYRLILMGVIRMRLRRMSDERMEAFLDKVIHYNE